MSDIEQSKSFNERIGEKIRESIGDMITEEELKGIVEKGIQMAFFEPQKSYDNYNRIVSKPPLITEVVKDLVAKQVEEEVKEYIKNNPKEIKIAIKNVLGDNAVHMISNIINSFFSSAFYTLEQNIENKIRNF